jgi:hypothetical protein
MQDAAKRITRAKVRPPEGTQPQNLAFASIVRQARTVRED